MSELVLEYWTNLQLSFRHHLTLYLTWGKMVVIYKLQSHIKRAWATIHHSRFKFVARDIAAHEYAFGWWIALNHLCEVDILPLQIIWDTSSSRRLQLLTSFGRVPGIASSIPVLVVILKPSQVVDFPSFRLKVSLFMRDNSSSRRFQLLASFGRVPGTATSFVFQCWWSSLNHLFMTTFQRVDSA